MNIHSDLIRLLPCKTSDNMSTALCRAFIWFAAETNYRRTVDSEISTPQHTIQTTICLPCLSKKQTSQVKYPEYWFCVSFRSSTNTKTCYFKNFPLESYPYNGFDTLELVSSCAKSRDFVSVTGIVLVGIWTLDLKDLTSSAAYQQSIPLLTNMSHTANGETART
jgi:hypothetical protein